MKKIEAFDLGVFNPYRMSNTKISVNKATKEGTVFFKEDFFNDSTPRKWEVRFDNSYPNVFWDPFEKKYRCYYSTFTRDISSSETSLDDRKKAHYQPNTNRIVSLCYAESSDGINWTKPNLGLTEFDGSYDNNIIGHYLHGTSILLDLHEKDESKKYKMFTKIDYGNGIHYIAVAFSKDGIHFGEFIKCQGFNPRADTHNSVIYDPQIQKYVLITRTWRDSYRMPCISFSDDFIHWSEIKEILYAHGFENQVYSMPTFRHNDYLIGLVSMFHEGDKMDENYDTVDLQLAYSHQYYGWNYIDHGNNFIERSPGSYYGENEFDSHVIFASLPIKIEDKTYFYYMGGNGRHTDFRETSFSRAYIEHDRFAFLEAKRPEFEAEIYTNGFVFLKNEFYIDAKIFEEGYIDIELYTFNNQKIEDVTIDVEKIDYRYKVIFDKDLDRSRTRLKIKFKNAKIYSLEGPFDVFRIEGSTSLLRD